MHVGHCQNCPVKMFVLFSHHTEETPIDAWHDYLFFSDLRSGVMRTETLQKSPSTRLTVPSGTDS